LVLVDQSAEQVAAIDCKRRVGVAVGVGDGAAWRGELERAVASVLVVMGGVQDSFEVAAPRMRMRSRRSVRTVRTRRSANAFAFGACSGVRVTSMPFPAEAFVEGSG
jgi:hypothetical protein